MKTATFSQLQKTCLSCSALLLLSTAIIHPANAYQERCSYNSDSQWRIVRSNLDAIQQKMAIPKNALEPISEQFMSLCNKTPHVPGLEVEYKNLKKINHEFRDQLVKLDELHSVAASVFVLEKKLKEKQASVENIKANLTQSSLSEKSPKDRQNLEIDLYLAKKEVKSLKKKIGKAEKAQSRLDQENAKLQILMTRIYGRTQTPWAQIRSHKGCLVEERPAVSMMKAFSGLLTLGALASGLGR